jgi:type IV secretory pathway TrbL component
MTEQDREIPGATPRQRAIEAYAGARDRTVGTLSEAPLIALAGGIAAGALIAALLPRTKAETRAVRPTARRVKDTAKAAFKAAKDTGGEKLSEVGITREKGEDTLRSLFQGVSEAARASASAALDAARKS